MLKRNDSFTLPNQKHLIPPSRNSLIQNQVDLSTPGLRNSLDLKVSPLYLLPTLLETHEIRITRERQMILHLRSERFCSTESNLPLDEREEKEEK
jgi:hypothetical protein